MTFEPVSPGQPLSGLEEADSLASSYYDYALPDEAIRLNPPEERDGSRMMVIPFRGFSRNDLILDGVSSVGNYLLPGDLLVINNTRVIPARIRGETASGRLIDVLFLSFGTAKGERIRFLARNPGKDGNEIRFPGGVTLTDIRRVEEEGCYEGVLPEGLDVLAWLQAEGEMPLPPYIQKHRPANHQDRDRYQTVFSRFPGSVAAPTAGLHFSEKILEGLVSKGVTVATVTLHVGAGTFRPLTGGRLEDHRMHQESYEIPIETLSLIEKTKRSGGRVIAVGTTVVRSLESHGKTGLLSGDTDLFIRPGFSFRHVDGLFTNFHQPRSTLLVLLDAFLGGDGSWRILYEEALSRGLSFLSYGDACLILPEDRGVRRPGG